VATFEQLAASNGVTEDASLRPAIPDARDFNLTYVKAEPGKGLLPTNPCEGGTKISPEMAQRS
jgi:hypothetical protein